MSKVGPNNPNWKGGLIEKSCAICSGSFSVKRVNSNARHCSLKCAGIAQRGVPKKSRKIEQRCAVCDLGFMVEPSRIAPQSGQARATQIGLAACHAFLTHTTLRRSAAA
jgi:hypothetical protein